MSKVWNGSKSHYYWFSFLNIFLKSLVSSNCVPRVLCTNKNLFILNPNTSRNIYKMINDLYIEIKF